MVNQINQQSKDKKALISLILGIVSQLSVVILLLNLIGDSLSTSIIFIPMPLVHLIGYFVFVIFPFVAIIGLILGVLSLKSTKRSFAIVGIILNSAGILFPLLYFLFY